MSSGSSEAGGIAPFGDFKMAKQARSRYAKGSTSIALAGTKNSRKDRGLDINGGPADVVFEAPTQGTKPTGIFKTISRP